MKRWDIRDPDDVSPRADLLRAIRNVERGRTGGIAFIAVLVAMSALREGHSFTSGVEVLLFGILVALCYAFAALCALRIDAFRRELRSLPPHWPT